MGNVISSYNINTVNGSTTRQAEIYTSVSSYNSTNSQPSIIYQDTNLLRRKI